MFTAMIGNDKNRQPGRPHFIRDWAEARHLSPNELADAVDADKSVISRWYSGAAPSKHYQEKLAALFGCERDALFRHPNEYWLAEFLRGRSEQEIERIRATLEIAFPRKSSDEG
jgi:transcriptional regulator with XRE-family HTH domain